jgi:adenylate cyclase
LIFPLRLKLALLSSILLVGGVATASVLLLTQSRLALESEITKRGVALVHNLARNATQPILLGEDLVVDQLLQTVSEESGVLHAWVLDKEGQLVASTAGPDRTSPRRLATHEARATRRDEGRLVLAAQMVYRGVEVGESQLVMDLEGLIGPVVERARKRVLIAAGGLLIVGILIAFAASTRVTQPLRVLRMGVNRLAAGDLDVRVVPTTRDEVAELTRSFNAMGESLSEKQQLETAFRRYVNDHVLRKVLDNPEGVPLQGELREVTLIVVDVRDFSRLSEGMPPREVVAFLNDALELITGRLLDHGATLDKYIGDAVLAYFGAPLATEDHAERAVAAAIAIQRAVEEQNEKRRASGDPSVPLHAGIGIHTGRVVVGNIGTDRKMDYTVIGDAVNVTHRLEKLAGRGTILVSDEVARRLHDRVSLEPQGSRHLSGREQPITVYRIRYQQT